MEEKLEGEEKNDEGWGSLNAVGCRMKIALHVNGGDNRQTNA